MGPTNMNNIFLLCDNITRKIDMFMHIVSIHPRILEQHPFHNGLKKLIFMYVLLYSETLWRMLDSNRLFGPPNWNVNIPFDSLI